MVRVQTIYDGDCRVGLIALLVLLWVLFAWTPEGAITRGTAPDTAMGRVHA